MEADIQALSARISRLEALLGSEPQRPCIHATTRSALQNLRQQVPDEMAAAHHAVNLLSRLTTRTLPSIDPTHTISLLQQLDSLQSIRAPAPTPPTADLAGLQVRVARLADSARQEGRDVDQLLAEFDTITARLNTAIMDLAARLGGVE